MGAAVVTVPGAPLPCLSRRYFSKRVPKDGGESQGPSHLAATALPGWLSSAPRSASFLRFSLPGDRVWSGL